MLKMQSISRCLQTIFLAIFVLGVMAAAQNPQTEPPIVVGKTSHGNLTQSGALFSGQIVPMAILNRPSIDRLNPEPEPPLPLFMIGANTSEGIFSGQIQTVHLGLTAKGNKAIDAGSVPE